MLAASLSISLSSTTKPVPTLPSTISWLAVYVLMLMADSAATHVIHRQVVLREADIACGRCNAGCAIDAPTASTSTSVTAKSPVAEPAMVPSELLPFKRNRAASKNTQIGDRKLAAAGFSNRSTRFENHCPCLGDGDWRVNADVAGRAASLRPTSINGVVILFEFGVRKSEAAPCTKTYRVTAFEFRNRTRPVRVRGSRKINVTSGNADVS